MRPAKHFKAPMWPEVENYCPPLVYNHKKQHYTRDNSNFISTMTKCRPELTSKYNRKENVTTNLSSINDPCKHSVERVGLQYLIDETAVITTVTEVEGNRKILGIEPGRDVWLSSVALKYQSNQFTTRSVIFSWDIFDFFLNKIKIQILKSTYLSFLTFLSVRVHL